jgi:hypothetical protein
MVRAALATLLLALPALGQDVAYPPLPAPPPPPALEPEREGETEVTEVNGGEPWEADLPIEAQRETAQARSRARVSVTATFGFLSDPGAGGGSSGGPRIGPTVSVAAPFYMGTRRRYLQFLWEARVSAGWVPSKFALLQLAPLWGMNLYFGPVLGLETRMGVGFGAQLFSASRFGMAMQGESAIALRPFKDDRMRLKLIGGVGMQLFFDTLGTGGLSAYLGAGFEMPL